MTDVCLSTLLTNGTNDRSGDFSNSWRRYVHTSRRDTQYCLLSEEGNPVRNKAQNYCNILYVWGPSWPTGPVRCGTLSTPPMWNLYLLWSVYERQTRREREREREREKKTEKKRNKASSENQLLFRLRIIKDCESFQTVSPTGSKTVRFNTTI